MCGIVGLHLKNPALEPRLGELLVPMVDALTVRGPDSAGYGLYRDDAPAGSLKYSLRTPAAGFAWGELAHRLDARLGPAGRGPAPGLRRRARHRRRGAGVPRRPRRPRRPRCGCSGGATRWRSTKTSGTRSRSATATACPPRAGYQGIGPHPDGDGVGGHDRALPPLRRRGGPRRRAQRLVLQPRQRAARPDRARPPLRHRQRHRGRSPADRRHHGAGRRPRGGAEDGRGDHGRLLHAARHDPHPVRRRARRRSPASRSWSPRPPTTSPSARSTARSPAFPASSRPTCSSRCPRRSTRGPGRQGERRARLRQPDHHARSTRRCAPCRTVPGSRSAIREASTTWRSACRPRLDITIDGNAGYFIGGLCDGPDITVNGFVGWSVAENLMSGTVRVHGNASESAGASSHGGLIVIEGDASSRAGISLKGGTLCVAGGVGHMSGFMAQAGTILVGGDAGEALGDSLYETVIYVGGSIRSLGSDARGEELTDADVAIVKDLLARTRLRPHRPGQRHAGRLGQAALQLQRPQGPEVLMSTHPNRPSFTFPPTVIDQVHTMAEEGRYEIRGLGRQAPPADVRRPRAGHRVGLALPARGLPRAVRHQDGARHAPREEAARARHPDHHRRHELRVAVGARQGGARPGGDGGRHLDDDRRRRHDAGGAPLVQDPRLPVPARRATASTPPTCTRPTRSRSSSARGPSPAAAACCSGRRSPSASPRCARCPPASTSARPRRHPDWTGPDDLRIKIEELREATGWEKPIYVKIGATRVDQRRQARGRGRRRRGRRRRHAGRHRRDPGRVHRARRHPDPARGAPRRRGAARDRHARQGAADRVGRHPLGRRRGQGPRPRRRRGVHRRGVARSRWAATGRPTGATARTTTPPTTTPRLGTEPGYCHHCHTGLCPVGITTQDPDLEQRLDPEVGARWLTNYLKAHDDGAHHARPGLRQVRRAPPRARGPRGADGRGGGDGRRPAGRHELDPRPLTAGAAAADRRRAWG